MDGYVIAGYAVILLTLAAYAWRVGARSRALRRGAVDAGERGGTDSGAGR